jgi:uncharacterized linocin/CFP29 family protein
VKHLLRELAPISDKGWELIDEEARDRLTPGLAVRKLTDFAGPKGWTYSATNLGRTEGAGAGPVAEVSAIQRRVLPLIELRADFSVSRAELRDGDRGALDVDFTSLDAAAQRMAVAENVAVFHGFTRAGMVGICDACANDTITLADEFDQYPRHVAKAVELLLEVGIAGPYGLALGSEGYTGVVETTEHGGYPVFEHLRHILNGPIVWAPGVRGAVVLSLRGGDFLYECGQDLSIGYDRHDGDTVQLYIEESFSFRVVTPEAAVALDGTGPT